MSITNAQAMGLYQLISKYQNDTNLPSKFSWALMRTKKKLQSLVDSISELRQPHPKYAEYEKVRVEKCAAAADKDEEGNPVIENNNYVISDEAKEALNTELTALRDGEYKEVFDTQESNEQKMKDMMEVECDIELFRFKMEYLPETISPSDLEILEPMVEE